MLPSKQEVQRLSEKYIMGFESASDDQRMQSSEQFWFRIMNECVRRRFLTSKDKQKNQCLGSSKNFDEFKNCMKNEKEAMEKYMIEMQFYRRKYDTCVEEGLRARYPLTNVEQVCGNKLVRFIRANNAIL